MESTRTLEQEKQGFLKKLGGLHLAKETVDLEDHREVMRMNRERIRKDLHVKLDPETGKLVEPSPVDSEEDPMHVGDIINYNTAPVTPPDVPQTPSSFGEDPRVEADPQPTSPPKESTLAQMGKGFLSAIPWILSSVAIGYAVSKAVPSKSQPDFINVPVISVEGEPQGPPAAE